MGNKITKIFLNWRVLLLVTLLFFSILAIRPNIFGTEGVEINSMLANSSVAEAGLSNPASKVLPTARERILSVNGEETNTVEEYYAVVSQLQANRTIRLETNEKAYTFLAPQSSNGKVDLGIKVKEASFSNLRMGLDLEGGTRVLLQPVGGIS